MKTFHLAFAVVFIFSIRIPDSSSLKRNENKTTGSRTKRQSSAATQYHPAWHPSNGANGGFAGLIPLADTISIGTVPGATGLTECKCIPTGGGATCNSVPTDGAGAIEVRILTKPDPAPRNISCSPGQSYCCVTKPTPTLQPPVPVSTCGVPTPITTIPNYTPTVGEASFGEYPWAAIMLGAPYYTVGTLNYSTYIGGGALIDSLNIITAAHKISTKKPDKVRVGVWKLQLGGTVGSNPLQLVKEPFEAVEIDVDSVVIHPGFNSTNLENDIAVIRLKTAAYTTPTTHIKPACLPEPGQSFAGQTCWVSGFGSDAYVNGSMQSILKEVDVPYIQGSVCEESLRKTRLGSTFILNRMSFMCAGGKIGKDACSGDGGSALVCEKVSGQGVWAVAGLVAWGIECGNEGVPGVYVHISNYVNWIKNNTKTA